MFMTSLIESHTGISTKNLVHSLLLFIKNIAYDRWNSKTKKSNWSSYHKDFNTFRSLMTFPSSTSAQQCYSSHIKTTLHSSIPSIKKLTYQESMTQMVSPLCWVTFLGVQSPPYWTSTSKVLDSQAGSFEFVKCACPFD